MDKLLSQLSALTGVDLTAQSILYAINEDETVEGKITIQDIINLANSTGNNVKTVEYTIGVDGVAGVDYNFSPAANMTEQSIQLGGTDIIPARSTLILCSVECVVGMSSGNGDIQVGRNPGADDYLVGQGAGVDATGDFIGRNQAGNNTTLAASSIYFSNTPDVNWDTLTAGTWKIWITYVDNSAL